MILDRDLRPCPICGAKAFVQHDVVDGFDFGWSVGCPRACIADGVHGFNEMIGDIVTTEKGENYDTVNNNPYYLDSI